MKRALLLAAACGHAAPAPARTIANAAPPDAAIAETPAPDSGDDESCSTSDEQPMRAGGADGKVSLETCDPAPNSQNEDSGGTAHVDLVFARGDQRIVETVNEWSFPDYDHERADTSFAGVLGAPGRDQAVLIEHTSSSYDGNGDTSATRAVLQMWAVEGGAWLKVEELEGSAIEIRLANDGSARVDVDGSARRLTFNAGAITP